jgi:hypothetical protein
MREDFSGSFTLDKPKKKIESKVSMVVTHNFAYVARSKEPDGPFRRSDDAMLGNRCDM